LSVTQHLRLTERRGGEHHHHHHHRCLQHKEEEEEEGLLHDLLGKVGDEAAIDVATAFCHEFGVEPRPADLVCQLPHLHLEALPARPPALTACWWWWRE